MKYSELKKIIQEEVNNVLNENDKVNKIEEKHLALSPKDLDIMKNELLDFIEIEYRKMKKSGLDVYHLIKYVIDDPKIRNKVMNLR